jgi:hypothetical protein
MPLLARHRKSLKFLRIDAMPTRNILNFKGFRDLTRLHLHASTVLDHPVSGLVPDGLQVFVISFDHVPDPMWQLQVHERLDRWMFFTEEWSADWFCR